MKRCLLLTDDLPNVGPMGGDSVKRSAGGAAQCLDDGPRRGADFGKVLLHSMANAGGRNFSVITRRAFVTLVFCSVHSLFVDHGVGAQKFD